MKMIKKASLFTMAAILACSSPMTLYAAENTEAEVSVTGRWRLVSDIYTNTLYIDTRDIYVMPDMTISLDERTDAPFTYEMEDGEILPQGMEEIVNGEFDSIKAVVSELTEEEREEYDVDNEEITQKMVLTLTGPDPANPVADASFEYVYVDFGEDTEYVYRMFSDKSFLVNDNTLTFVNNPEYGNMLDMIMNDGEKTGELSIKGYGDVEEPVVVFSWEKGTGKEYLLTEADETTITLTDREDKNSVLVLAKKAE